MSNAVLSKAAPSASRTPNLQLLFETTICDLIWSALHIGILATLMNDAGKRNVTPNVRPWRHLLSQDREALVLAVKFCREDGLGPDLARAMTDLYAHFGAAKTQLEPFSRSGPLAAPTRDALEAGVRDWRRICVRASEVLASLQDAAEASIKPDMREDAQTLIDFLTEAARGGTSRIDGNGEISPPVLRQRRGTPRVSAKGVCRLFAGGAVYRADLQDASRSGLGLTCNAPVEVNATVDVELPDGRKLSTVVVRKTPDRIAVRFAQILRLDDPLLGAN